MTQTQDAVRAAARNWALRSREPEFDDWDGLTDWLASNPVNADEYDLARDDDDWVDSVFAARPPAVGSGPKPASAFLRRARWPMAAAAAVGALCISGWYAFDAGSAENYATASGERRTLVLDRGTRIMMNGSTRLAVVGPRRVRLVDGQAVFEVRHDAADPFELSVGRAKIVDAGTVFDVSSSDGTLAVDVAEGEVRYHADEADVTLAAGQGLSRIGSARITLQRNDPSTIGAWRLGYLAYADTTLGQVAADLSRNLGRHITVGGSDKARRFSGMLRIEGSAEAVLASAGPLLGVEFQRQGAGWVMVSAPGVR